MKGLATEIQNDWPRTAGSLRLDVVFGYVVFVMMIASISVPIARLFNYALPIVALLLIVANRGVNLGELSRSYLVIVVCGIILAPFANREGLRDLYLIMTGLSVAIIGYRVLLTWNTIFFAALLGLIVNISISGLGGGSGLSPSSFSLDFWRSSSTLESDFSYVFGLLAVWAVYTRNWKQFALALFLSVLTLKRIAIIGILLCLIIQLIPKAIVPKLLNPLVMIFSNGLLLLLILMYGSGNLNSLIVELTGQSGNQFGMGRQELYRYIVADYFREPLRFMLIGMGPGEAYTVMKGGAVLLQKANLHSDILKIFYEYGALVLMGFLWALYTTRKTGVLLIALYTNVLLLTDNNLIYPYYIYFTTLIAACIAAADVSDQPSITSSNSNDG